MSGLGKIPPGDYKPGNLALVSGKKELCEEWEEGQCFHLVKVEKGRRVSGV